MNKLLETLPLSEEQRPALETIDENILISAGAGSGKTRVLIARFCNLVLAGKAKLSEILGITFTEKAASEMKSRLVELFTKLGREDLRREVEASYVSTMHSFASRLLKEYALEVGCDPEFQVLGEDERAVLETEVWEKLLETQALELPIYPLLLELKSKEALKVEMLTLRSKLTSLGLKNPWEFQVPESELQEAKKEILTHLKSAIQTIEAGSDLSKSEAKVLEGFRHAEVEFRSGGNPEALQQSSKFTLTGKRAEWKELLTETREKIKEALLLIEEKGTRSKRENMMNLLALFNERLQEEKRTRAVLDYDDLLNDLLRFLRRDDRIAKAIRSDLQKKFRFILMDELQDSNSVEKEILERLSSGKNLFLVGDAKQSIYAFRQADVGIFLELEKNCEGDRGQVTGSSLIRLQDNYRSRPEILDFINGFFW